jgi:integrase
MKGTVIKRGKSWSVVLDLGRDAAGKRKREWHSGYRTKKDAERARIELLSSIDKNTHVSPSKLTVNNFLADEWLPAIRASVRPSTLDSYEQMIRVHVAPTLGATKLQKLTAAQLNGFYADLLEGGRRDGKGLAPKSVRNIHVVLRKALGDAVRWNLLTRNPAEFADPPKLVDSGRREMASWTAQELSTFLDATSDHHLFAAWLLAASTGMRRGEVLGLRWQDIDFNNSRLGVRQTVITVNYEVLLSTPKTVKGRRSIALDSRTLATLKEHRKRQLEERMSVGIYHDKGLVFARPDGGPIHPDFFSQSFDRLVAKTKLPRIRLHDLRHTHATLALQAGVHPKVVSERLGHSSVSFTMDVYSHAIPAMQADAAEAVAAPLRDEGR